MAASEMGNAPPYVFSWFSGQQLYKALPIPVDLMKSFMWHGFLSIGHYPTKKTTGVGIGLHVHDATWVAQVAGTKTWVVAPPGNPPGAPYQKYEAYSASDRLQRCTQHEGEIVFLPGGWWHATENRGWSFAYGFQRSNFYDNVPASAHRLIAQAAIGNVAALEDANLQRSRDSLAEIAFVNGHVEVVNFLDKEAALSKDQLRMGLEISAMSAHASLFQLLMPRTISKKKNFPKWAKPVAEGAVAGGSEEILRLLLDARASVHKPDDEGQRPLHLAAKRGHACCVQLLLQKRANKDDKNSYGLTPLQLASEPGAAHTSVRRLLESRDDGEL